MLWYNFILDLIFVVFIVNYHTKKQKKEIEPQHTVYVVVNFLCQAIFDFLLFLGMLLYANEVETKEK